MRRLLLLFQVLALVTVGALWASEYDYGPVVIAKEYESKVVLFVGDPVRTITEPGFDLRNWQLPFLFQVETYDNRLQYLNAEPVEITARGEKIIVDFYAVWRITDPLEFMKSFPPPGMENAARRIEVVVNAVVGDTVADLTVSDLLQRADELAHLSEQATGKLTGRGVEIVDIRLNRTELPRSIEPIVYEQMREQRRALSREFRAQGEREAREIRAEAEREARTILAQARSESEVIRGDGDAQAARIYAEAYGADRDFYAFVRSLEAYRKTLGAGTTMVLPPNHEFFRFLQPSGAFDGKRPAPARPVPARPAAAVPAADPAAALPTP